MSALIRDVQLSPFGVSEMGWSTGTYLFLLAVMYSLPLWIQDAWAEFGAPGLAEAVVRAEADVRWRRAAAQAALCGLMVATIVVLRSQTSLDFIYFAF